MKKYIPVLMEIYQEMQKVNELTDNSYKAWKEKNPDKYRWHYNGPSNKYSDTMLHYLITIINKLNN